MEPHSPFAGTPGGLNVEGIVRDLAELRSTREELERSKAQLAEAQALAKIGSWEWDIPANVVVWSDELYRIYGLEPGAIEPNYEEFLSRVHPDDRASVDERNHKAFADHQPFEDVKRILHADGGVFLMRTRGEVVTDNEGNPVRMIGVCEDITEAVRAREATEALAAIVTSSDDAIVSYSADGIITSWNPGAERLYGFRADEVIGRRADLLVPAERSDEEARILEQLLQGTPVDHFETQRLRRDGSIVEVSLSVSARRGPRGRLEGLSTIARDVTERKRLEDKLRHLADHDALTELFNRRRFEEELGLTLSQAERYGLSGAVLVLDVDNFKYVNDTMSHGVGDELLRQVARLLEEHTSRAHVLARLGGDEFAVLATHAGPGEVRALADQLLAAIRENAVVTNGHTIRVTASIGAALFDDQTAGDDDLLAAANRAMHAAKDAGRDRLELQSPARWREARRQARKGWEHRLHAALDNDLFELHCQPILDLARNEVSQYELLLRLREGEELIPPGAFLGAAERLGLIRAIDRWVVGQSIELLAEHARAGRQLTLEVNLSGRSVGDRELTAMIGRDVAAAGIDPRSLIFEITETAAIANMDEARRFACELSDAGCGFALDDFGTGFGSFYYLKHLPAEYLKIDGDFVRTPRSQTDELVIEAIVQVARGLGKRTIAEFVTDAATLERVRELGVDFAQGYHVGRPFPVERLADAGTVGM